MIRVLIVEDSAVVRDFLSYVLGSDPEITVVGIAHDGAEAVELVQRLRPDVVTMDIHMPGMNGYAATRQIMERTPTRIVIVTSSLMATETAGSFRALEAGALAVVRHPAALGEPGHAAAVREFLQTVKLMSEVPVVRRWRAGGKAAPAAIAQRAPPPRLQAAQARIVAIGASTGGPLALQHILAALPREFPVPVLIVQHIATGFGLGMAEWLARSCGRPVQLATHGEYFKPGHVYIGPEGYQLGADASGRAMVARGEPEHGHCPSVSHLFRSVAASYANRATGVLLTGMGRDGAEELGLMRARGAITIAQDRATSVVHGMPGAAIQLGAATHVLPLEDIAPALSTLAGAKG